ncbi:hypothetical protein ACTZWW_17525 [Salinarimonas sp. NSM]|uniref:hypothetical protein n=1 Tax=Salinarimonas sp. NSM TaxID=3458003 RepID=UPI004035EC60
MRLVPAIAACVLSAVASCVVPASAAELLRGRCHMDYCSWFSIEEYNIVTAEGGEVLKRATLKSWESHHPGGSYDSPGRREGGDPFTTWFLCSKTRPSLVWPVEVGGFEQVELAPIADGTPAGATTYAYVLYFAGCHGLALGDDPRLDDLDGLARQYGYRGGADAVRVHAIQSLDELRVGHGGATR